MTATKMSEVFELPLRKVTEADKCIRDADTSSIAVSGSPGVRSAIVRAVNAHDALVEALQHISGLTPSKANAADARALHLSVKAIADTALALAEGRA